MTEHIGAVIDKEPGMLPAAVDAETREKIVAAVVVIAVSVGGAVGGVLSIRKSQAKGESATLRHVQHLGSPYLPQL